MATGKALGCDQIRKMGIDYVNGRLSPALADKISRHIKYCTHCRNEIRILQYTDRISRDAAGMGLDIQQVVSLTHIKPPVSGPKIMTVREMNQKLHEVHRDIRVSSDQKRLQVLDLVHKFVADTQRFSGAPGRLTAVASWMAWQRRLGRLVNQILDDPDLKTYKSFLAQHSKLLLQQGLVYRLQNDFRQAEALLQRALVIGLGLKHPVLDVVSQRLFGEVVFYQGRYGQAEKIFLTALNQSRDRNLPEETGLLLRDIGNTFFMRRRYDACLKYLEQALDISESRGFVSRTVLDLINLSGIHFFMGDVSEACRRAEQARYRAEPGADTHLKAYIYANLGTFYAELGDLEQSEMHWNQAGAFFRQTGTIEDRINLRRNMALLQYRMQRFRNVETELAGVMSYDIDNPDLQAKLLLLSARTKRHLQDISGAEKAAAQALEIARRTEIPMLIRSVYREVAFNALARNQIDSALKYLEKSTLGRKRWPREPDTVFTLETIVNEAEIYAKAGFSDLARRKKTAARKVYRNLLKRLEQPPFSIHSNEKQFQEQLAARLKQIKI